MPNPPQTPADTHRAQLRQYQAHCDRLRKEVAVVSPLLTSANLRRIARVLDTDSRMPNASAEDQEALHEALLELADHLEPPIRVTFPKDGKDHV